MDNELEKRSDEEESEKHRLAYRNLSPRDQGKVDDVSKSINAMDVARKKRLEKEKGDADWNSRFERNRGGAALPIGSKPG